MLGLAITTAVYTNILKYDGFASFAATLENNLHRGHEVLKL